MAFDTLDTDSVVTAGITFSNGNLTALGITGSTLSTSGIAQSLEGKKSGKWYVEATCVAVSGNVDGVGVTSSTGVGLQFIGQSNTANQNGWAFYTNGFVFNQGATQTAVNTATYTAGDTIGLAIDLDNSRVWWRKNAGGWIGTSGTPDPATNTNGFNISATVATNNRIYPAANLSGAAAKFTFNFGATAFANAAPSGFGGWTNTTAGTYFGTFATTGRGANQNTPPQNDKAVSQYTASITGSVTSIILPFCGTTVTDIKGVIYDDTGSGGLPGSLLGVSTNTITSAGRGESSLTFSGVSVTSGSNYWFGIVSDSVPSTSNNVTACAPQTGGIKHNSGTYASPTNPFGASPSSTNFRFPIIVNVDSAVSVDLTGAEATAATGSLTVAGAATFSLVAVSATASAGTLGITTDQGVVLSGVAGAASAGTFTAEANEAIDLLSVSAAAAVGSFTLSVGSVFALSGVEAQALAGLLSPTQDILTIPILTIMNDNPIPIEGDMTGDYIPMKESMPYQVALDSILNTNPIPMTGIMSAVPVPTEGSVP